MLLESSKIGERLQPVFLSFRCYFKRVIIAGGRWHDLIVICGLEVKWKGILNHHTNISNSVHRIPLVIFFNFNILSNVLNFNILTTN